MSRPAIVVENLSKKFQIGAGGGPAYHRMTELLTGLPKYAFQKARQSLRRAALTLPPGESSHSEERASQSSTEFWALKDVSFEVQPGEVVGIIGRNGAGKSTLLKILSRITEPTSGRFGIRGRVASLLEVGTGFHPELTGRENIYVSGITLGMTRAEIKKRFDEIVDFSGVEKFLDTTVKHYSSGMQVRLGFAVAAHLESEILIVDEVLAVGDEEFQKKCINAMSDIGEQGKAVLVVSHNPSTLQSLCNSALLLTCGCSTRHELIEVALSQALATNACVTSWRGEYGNAKIKLLETWAHSRSEDGIFKTSAPIEIGVRLRLLAPIESLVYGLRVFSSNGQPLIYRLFDDHFRSESITYPEGELSRAVVIPADTLASGNYRVSFEIGIAYKETVVNGGVGDLDFEVANIDGLGCRFPVGNATGYASLLRPNWNVIIR